MSDDTLKPDFSPVNEQPSSAPAHSGETTEERNRRPVEQRDRTGSEKRGAQQDRTGRDDRPARNDRTGREDRPWRNDRTGRDDRPRRDDRAERDDRPRRDDRQGREDRPGREDRAGRPPRDGRFERQERPGRTERSDRPGRSGQAPGGRDDSFGNHSPRPRGRRDGEGAPGGGPGGAAGALIELDRELMKLLVRRATLVSRIRGGKEHAASPAAIQAEKAVRIAWETGALAFSKDPRFSRQLFTLLQEVQVLRKEQADAANSFTLSPSLSPVSGSLTGPADAADAQMRVALAAWLGQEVELDKLMLSADLLSTVHACTQAGADITREGRSPGLGRVRVAAGPALRVMSRSLFVGEDLLTLYLMAFMAVGSPGSCRFTGGSRLKDADLSPLRHTLPLFGARLAHVVPHSHGLPANVESSGQIPPAVMLPADLPFVGLCALLLAPLVWGQPVTLNLASLPASVATAALAAVRPLHREAGAEVETHGPNLVYTPGPLRLPQRPELPLDPLLSAYLLSLPAFVGGSLRLTGHWQSHMPKAQEAAQLLSFAGVCLRSDREGVTAEAGAAPFTLPLQESELSPELGPLYLALLARRHALLGETRLPHVPPLFAREEEEDNTNASLAREFFARLGLVLEPDRLYRAGALTEGVAPGPETKTPDTEVPDWTSPDAYWSMAYALGAFVRPGLRLANPGGVGELMPPFWKIYNSLPEPIDPALLQQETVQEPTVDKPARRRVIAD